ncbi:MAG: GNAT family N-acetyltransferase [Nitrospinae bacterium]|nr:GNAT family N-acetyltransferase [Nitrospinota bacterium]
MSQIYIVHEERGNGYARQAINFIEEGLGRKMRLDKIRLTVNKNNINSIAAYLKMGFIKKDSVVTDIGNGFVMDDYIMEKRISPVHGKGN